MKALIRLIPNMITAGTKLWATHKEWSAKKKIVIYTLAPVSLIVFTLVVKYAGWENAAMAAQLITEMLEAFAAVEM